MTETTQWSAVNFVRRSSYREAVLHRLAASPATPTTIATDTDLRLTHVSLALGRLRNRSLVELLVAEDQRKRRIHGLTDRGNRVHASGAS
jgi:DNA-binding transcriptional ArsR family regulator